MYKITIPEVGGIIVKRHVCTRLNPSFSAFGRNVDLISIINAFQLDFFSRLRRGTLKTLFVPRVSLARIKMRFPNIEYHNRRERARYTFRFSKH